MPVWLGCMLVLAIHRVEVFVDAGASEYLVVR